MGVIRTMTTDQELLTPNGLKLSDGFLHDFYLTRVDHDPHRFIGPGVVSPKGFFMLTDRRHGGPFYGHA